MIPWSAPREVRDFLSLPRSARMEPIVDRFESIQRRIEVHGFELSVHLLATNIHESGHFSSGAWITTKPDFHHGGSNMSNLSRHLLLGFTIVLAAGVLIAPSSAIDCFVNRGHCSVSVSAVEYTGSPTTPCTVGNPVVLINAYAKCKGIGPAGPVTIYRCGAFDHPFTFSGSGVTHTIGVKTTWGDLIDGGKCKDLLYSNDA